MLINILKNPHMGTLVVFIILVINIHPWYNFSTPSQLRTEIEVQVLEGEPTEK